MDEQTKKHFESWLESQFPDEDSRDKARSMMLKVFEGDPEHWLAVGWPGLCDYSGAWMA